MKCVNAHVRKYYFINKKETRQSPVLPYSHDVCFSHQYLWPDGKILFLQLTLSSVTRKSYP